MAVTFELEGQEFMGLNGGPMFPFTEAVSFYVKCETQPEVDELWDKLIQDGGQPSQCGWLKDKFGLSWQIILDPRSAECSVIRILTEPSASCKPCCRCRRSISLG